MKAFRDEIEAALRAGTAETALLEIVKRHKDAGLAQQSAYAALEELWTEFGCELRDDGPALPACDLLEGLMDRVWGFCSVRDAIWDTSLSSKSTP